MSQTFARSLTELFQLNSNTRLDADLLNRLLRSLDARFLPLEQQKGSLDTAIEQVRNVGLARINEVLTPAIESILDVQARGFLIARSSTAAELAEGNVLTFNIGDESERALFTPSPFTALTRQATIDDYAIARTIAYDQDAGDYLCEVISVTGDPGPHEDWVIGALAGPTVAMLQYLSDAQSARDAAIEARDAAVPAAGTATDAAGVSTAQATLASEWAENPEDVEVEAGKFSAKHHAIKAAASAAAAATFDPDAYYLKGETYTRAEIDAGISDAVDALIGGAPGALDTLKEFADAINDDASFAATVTTALAGKLSLAGGTLTGLLTLLSYKETALSLGIGTSFTPDLATGSVFRGQSSGNATLNMPAAVAGKSFSYQHTYGGAHTFATAGATVKWAGGDPPDPSSTNGAIDVYVFCCFVDGVWLAFDGGRGFA